MINELWLAISWTSNPWLIGAFERTALKKYNFSKPEILSYLYFYYDTDVALALKFYFKINGT